MNFPMDDGLVLCEEDDVPATKTNTFLGGTSIQERGNDAGAT